MKEYYYVQPSAVHMALALNYYGPLAVAFVAMDDFFAYRYNIRSYISTPIPTRLSVLSP